MSQSELASRILAMAKSVKGSSRWEWPAWSTGELLMVALVLNDHDALTADGYTIVQAMDRVDLTAGELRAIERALL